MEQEGQTCTTGTCGSKCCNCGCHKGAGLMVVIFGGIFLLGALGVLEAQVVNLLWPIIVILVGLMKLGKGRCRCC